MQSLLASIVLLAGAGAQEPQPGYTDTPLLPDSRWRVHDAARPHPVTVTPAPTAAPAAAPHDAIVLFDGRDLGAFTGKDGKAQWLVGDGCMTVNGTGDIRTVREFGDCQLHIEWSTPAEVKGHSQERGNSGVFFFERYELQVLDSFANVTYADGQAAALYGQFPPLVNCCRRPGEWQAYDVVFVAPRFDPEGKLLSPARATVLHNGILVHHDRALLGATAHRTLPRYQAHAPRGAIKLQDHGNPVRYRNVWVRDLDLGPGSPAASDAAAVKPETSPKGFDK